MLTLSEARSSKSLPPTTMRIEDEEDEGVEEDLGADRSPSKFSQISASVKESSEKSAFETKKKNTSSSSSKPSNEVEQD